MPRARPASLLFLALAASGCRTSTPVESVTKTDPGLTAEDQATLPDYKPRFVNLPVDANKALNHPQATPGLALQSDDEPLPAVAGARYFVTVYGYQGTGAANLPRFTHSWMVLVRAQGDQLATATLTFFTLSWDAADGEIGLFQPPERGHNYTLAETFALAGSLGAPVVTQRSPLFEVDADLYSMAVKQFRKLTAGEETGAVRYKMRDDFPARQLVANNVSGGYTNCIHALSDLLPGAGGSLLQTGTSRGFAASDQVLAWFMTHSHVVGQNVTHDAELASRLGI